MRQRKDTHEEAELRAVLNRHGFEDAAANMTMWLCDVRHALREWAKFDRQQEDSE